MEPEFRKVFAPRRQRTIFSFRRKSDLALFVGSLAMFFLGLTAFGAVFVMLHSKDRAPAPVVFPPPPLRRPDAKPSREERFEPEPAPEPPPAANAEEPPAEAAPEPNKEPLKKAPETRPVEKKKEKEKEKEKSEKTADKTTEKPAEKTTKAPPSLPMSGPYVLFQTGAEAPRLSTDDSAEVQADSITADGQRALQITYRMQQGDWVRVGYPRRLNFKGGKRLQLSFRGEGAFNTFEVAIQDSDGTIASVAWPNRTGANTWTAADVPLDILAVWGGDGKMEWGNVRMIFMRVAKQPRDQGGAGRVVVKGFKILP